MRGKEGVELGQRQALPVQNGPRAASGRSEAWERSTPGRPPTPAPVLQDQPWDNRGAQHVVPLREVDEGRVPASQNLVKRDPPGKRMQTTSVFVPQEPREHNENGESHDTGR
ncbi:unnamed protein product [Rangifer tarandus platyrhynchus]